MGKLLREIHSWAYNEVVKVCNQLKLERPHQLDNFYVNFRDYANQNTEVLIEIEKRKKLVALSSPKLIFIACGQRTEKEKALGKEIEALVNSKDNLYAFLAESAHDLNSLTTNIFESLNKCSGFIAVMHKRDKKENTNKFSSSVWINQEIAIASFLRHTQHRNILVLIFEETGIQRKGVLEYLHANPISFTKDKEVLDEVRRWLENTQFIGTEKSGRKGHSL